jgi:hypothetical protein
MLPVPQCTLVRLLAPLLRLTDTELDCWRRLSLDGGGAWRTPARGHPSRSVLQRYDHICRGWSEQRERPVRSTPGLRWTPSTGNRWRGAGTAACLGVVVWIGRSWTSSNNPYTTPHRTLTAALYSQLAGYWSQLN